jgi:rhamnose utilization protein RhaD (predicted bifunctional aldolase and dehydrogenase)
MDHNIKELIRISRFYGKDKGFVIAGGGNTSYKDDRQIWVKASGVSLETIDEEGFVCLSREKLKVIAVKSYSPDSVKRESEVKEDLANAIVSIGSKRPSVETSMHEIIDYSFVVHTHPTKVNGMMCSNNARQACSELFGEEALFIPYTDPGYILFKKVESEINGFRSKHGFCPKLIFLENHGVFVAADTTGEIMSIYDKIMQKLDSRIRKELPSEICESYSSVLANKVKELNPGYASLSATGRTSDLIRHFVESGESFKNADTSFSPDDIVYCKAHYLFLEKKENRDAQLVDAKQKIKAYFLKYGYLPKVLAIEKEGILAVEDTQKSIENVLEVFTNILKISFLSQNFGGPKFMTSEQIAFIDNWEVENYRRKMAKV